MRQCAHDALEGRLIVFLIQINFLTFSYIIDAFHRLGEPKSHHVSKSGIQHHFQVNSFIQTNIILFLITKPV